ncbi:MAG: TetR/AcrR family transcriptional regulator [Chitinophagaceae bacterium]
MEAKERISAKAEELFMKFGIRSVSMDDIANHLGMSKKTLYQYYEDKDELVMAVVMNHISTLEQDCFAINTTAKDAIDEIFITIDQVIDDFNDMNPMLLHDLQKFHYRAYERFTQHKDKFMMDTLRKNLEWGIRDGLYREDIKIEMMARFRIECIMIPFNVATFPPGKFNLGELSKEFLIHFTYGIATIKGHKQIQKQIQQRQKSLTHEENKK